ncbi:MAG: phosphate acyltransferase [Dermatophilus congolensis]|nr:phosphate acyltransferase [Dermatophilus congolensis]
MHRRILVVPTGQRESVTSVCLGLVGAIGESGNDVGYAKPIAQHLADGAEDQSIDVFRMVTSLRPPASLSAAHVMEVLATGAMDTLMAEVLAQLDDTISSRDTMVIEGLAPLRESVITGQLNRELATSLDADVLLVASARTFGIDSALEQAVMTARSYRDRHVDRVIGVVLEGFTQEEADQVDAIRVRFAERGLRLVAAVENSRELSRIRVGDLARELRLEVVSPGDLNRRIKGTIVAAQAVPGFLDYLTPGRLVIVPGDRHEVLMASALAEMRGRPLGAVLLTAGVTPPPQVLDLVGPALELGLPMLATDALTYQVAADVHALDVQIPADDEERAAGIMRRYAEAFDPGWLGDIIRTSRPQRITTAQIRANAFRALAGGRFTVALAGPMTGAWIQAADSLDSLGLVRSVFVDAPENLATVARDAGVAAPQNVRIADPSMPASDLAAVLAERRGCSEQEAAEALTDPLTRALTMLAAGTVDAVIGDEVAPGSRLLTLADEIIGRRADIPGLTSANVLLGADEVVVYADCALNEMPAADALAAIAELASEGAAAVGVEPKIAFISQGRGVSVEDGVEQRIRDAVGVLAAKRPDLDVDGPFEFEAAVSPERARALSLDGEVAGRANVCVFPDRRSAQTMFTAMQRSTGASQIGPLVHGFLKTVNAVPAGASTEEIIDLIGLTALQAARI